MEDIAVGIIGAIVIVLSTIGAASIFIDQRVFIDIKTQCEKQGFIQNKTTRITCKVEQS